MRKRREKISRSGSVEYCNKKDGREKTGEKLPRDLNDLVSQGGFVRNGMSNNSEVINSGKKADTLTLSDEEISKLFEDEEMEVLLKPIESLSQGTFISKKKSKKCDEPIRRKEFQRKDDFEEKVRESIQNESDKKEIFETQNEPVVYEDMRSQLDSEKSVEADRITNINQVVQKVDFEEKNGSDNLSKNSSTFVNESEAEISDVSVIESSFSMHNEKVNNHEVADTLKSTESKKGIVQEESVLQDELICQGQSSNPIATGTSVKSVLNPFKPLKPYKPIRNTKLTCIFLENTSEMAKQIDNLNKIVNSVRNGYVCIINYGSKVMQTELFDVSAMECCELFVNDDLGEKSCLYDALFALERIVFDSYCKVLETEEERIRINKIEIMGIGRGFDNCSLDSKESGINCFSKIAKNPNVMTKYFSLTEESFIDIAIIGFRSIGAINRNYM